MNSDACPQNPWLIFQDWFSRAQKTTLPNPNAFVLSTFQQDGGMSSRVLLLKEFSSQGFVFYTNYESAKSMELTKHAQCAMNFFWDPLALQIRVQGSAKKEGTGDDYFSTRPRLSQIGAWASKQSQTLPNRKNLEERVAMLEEKFKNQPVPCPENWGPWVITPTRFEFWEGQVGRLHHRTEFSKKNEAWQSRFLYP